jgi:hypothetical protein
MSIKRSIFISSILIIILFVTSCGGDKNEFVITELVLSLDKTKILDDNSDAIIVKVIDQAGNDVSSEVDIFAGDDLVQGLKVRSDVHGSIIVHAEYQGLLSNNETITVIEDIGLKYDRMILLEQFTATWCQYCPRAITAIDDITTLGEDIVHIGYHMNGDPYSYEYNYSLFESFERFELTGIPAVVAGRELVWDLSRNQLTGLYKEVRTGFSVSFNDDGSGVEAVIDVRFGIIYNESLSVTVYVIEDDLIGDQTNYYNSDPSSPWYQMGDVIENFSHNNVMRKTLTDMFGDIIPAGSIDIGSEYRLVFNNTNLNVSNLDNSSIVAFVSYASGLETDEVINAIVCDFGETVESPVIID